MEVQGSLRLAIVAIAALVFPGADALAAATKVDEGFATRSSNGRIRTGINRGKAGDDVVFWVQWKDLDTHTKVHCTVRKDNASGEVLFEEDGEIDTQEGEEGVFSLCPMETEADDTGAFWVAQKINGEQVAERIIVLESASWWGGLSMYRKWKYGIGALALVIVGVGWVRKKMSGGGSLAGIDSDAEGKLASGGRGDRLQGEGRARRERRTGAAAQAHGPGSLRSVQEASRRGQGRAHRQSR